MSRVPCGYGGKRKDLEKNIYCRQRYMDSLAFFFFFGDQRLSEKCVVMI